MSMQLPTDVAPIPGSPGTVRSKADRFARTAAAIVEAVSGLETAIAETRNHDSQALDELAENAHDVAERLSTLRERYQTAADALSGFATELESAQTQAQALIGESGQAQSSVDYLDRQITTYTQQRQQTTDPTELVEVTQHLTQLHARRRHRVEDLASVRARFERIVEALRQSGRDAASRMRAVTDSDGLNDSIWDNVMGWVQENAEILKAIHEVLKWITTGLSILSFFFPVLAPFALAAAALTAGLSLVLALAGEMSWVDFALDVLTVATFGVAAVATRAIGGVMTALKGTRVARLTAQGARSPLRSVTGSFNGVLAGRNGMQIGRIRLPSTQWAREVFQAKGLTNAHFLRVADRARAGAGGPLDDMLIGMGRDSMRTIRIAFGVRTVATQTDSILNDRIPALVDVLPQLADLPGADIVTGISEGYQDFRETATWRVGS